MKKLLIPLVLLLSACATTSVTSETPSSRSGKALLVVKDNIVTIRDAFSIPCQKGLVAQVDCQKVNSIYQQSKPAYDTAVDAAVIALTSGNANDVQAYRDKETALLNFATELSQLAAKYGVNQK